MLTLNDLMRRVRDLPPLPGAALKLLTMCRDPEVPLRDIVGVIEVEPALTLKVLRLANSPFYGLRRKVATVRDAVVNLGADAIVNCVLAGCLANLYGRESRGYSQTPEDAWRHAVGTAVCAQGLAERCERPLAPLAFTCGLLHDVGKTVLGTRPETERFRILPMAEREGISFLQAERAVLGFDHAQAGAALAEHWNLPGEIVESIRWQYEPLRAPRYPRLASLVHVGHVLCISLSPELDVDNLTVRFPLDILEKLGIGAEDIADIGPAVSDKIDATIEAFQAIQAAAATA